MDVKTTLFNRELKKEMYMIQPEGFTSTDESKVYKLKRSTYELKQVSRNWIMYFDKVIKMYDFIRNGKEPCVYKWTFDSVVIFLVLYVDDILFLENDIPTLQSVKLWLSSQFSIKDLG